MADKEEVNRVACKFENIYGTDALCKVAMSSVNKLLVEKGLLTEDELLDAFIDELGDAFASLKEETDSI